MFFVSIYDNVVILLFQIVDVLGKVIFVDISQYNVISIVVIVIVVSILIFNFFFGTIFFSVGFVLFIRVVMGIYFFKLVLNFGYGLKYKGEKSFFILYRICYFVRDLVKFNFKLYFYYR